MTSDLIRGHRLRNPLASEEKTLKLVLQGDDHTEYEQGIEGVFSGTGAVSQAWRTLTRTVNKHSTSRLLRGISRLTVVSIGLQAHEDPQQIFESINGTGRPLTESEKVKNWLLIGLPERTQKRLHDQHWRVIENSLGVKHSTIPIDQFLRDFMRWKTGAIISVDKTYEQLRRWALKREMASQEGREELCQELSEAAKLYGCLIGTGDPHPNDSVEKQLRHLRTMDIGVHHPFTLRLLSDSRGRFGEQMANDEDLGQVLLVISTWVTRLWLADFGLNGMNRAITQLAVDAGPIDKSGYADYWVNKIRNLRDQKIGVPDDTQVLAGMQTRRAYGGSASKVTFSVLCEMMDNKKYEDTVDRSNLQIEHIMPQNLTEQWRSELGENAEETHGLFKNRLANLTLTQFNPELGDSPFSTKREIYKKSSIGLTRDIADYDVWNDESMETRVTDLFDRAIALWPWENDQTTEIADQSLRWRVSEGGWRSEESAAQLVINVVAKLLDIDAANKSRLLGPRLRNDIHLATEYPLEIDIRPNNQMRRVPNHEHIVVFPYSRTYASTVERCQQFAERCNVDMEFDVRVVPPMKQFWQRLKDETGGVPGQKDSWVGSVQWSSGVHHDVVGISINKSYTYIYVKSSDDKTNANGINRMMRHSTRVIESFSDQKTWGNELKEAENGRSISIYLEFEFENREEWGDAINWITDQCERMHDVIGMDISTQSQTELPPENALATEESI